MNQGQSSVEDAFTAFQDVTPDGFMMFRPVRSDNGQIIDLEWTFVNASASQMVGRDPDDLIGKRLLVEMPGNKDEGLFDAYVGVIETGQTWQNEFHYDHGGITAWFRTTAAKSGDGIALSFANISEVRKSDERRKNLIDGLLAFVGVLSLDGILLEANETAVDAAGGDRSTVIGVPFWDCYWWGVDQATQDRLKDAVATAATGERVRYDAQIRVVGGQRLWIDFQIVPILNAAGDVVEMIPSGVDITERKQAEAHSQFLIQELSHRVKNTLATIQSMAGQTLRTAQTMTDFQDSFRARLQSIAASHDLLVEFEHQEVPMIALVRGQVIPYAADEARLVLTGADIQLPGDAAHGLSLVLHELATNASKYGALSVETGVVHVDWTVSMEQGNRILALNWTERGGPPVEKPTRQGFGTRLIKRSLGTGDRPAVLDYHASGLSCKLAMTLT